MFWKLPKSIIANVDIAHKRLIFSTMQPVVDLPRCGYEVLHNT